MTADAPRPPAPRSDPGLPQTEAAFPARLPVTLAPHRTLLTAYLLASLALGPFFPLLLVPLFFRYRSLRYEIDEEGITMRWGVLFRREISLTYARIQDIHLSSNVVERWLGLARIQVQTASGSSGAEMTIVGLREFAAMRDFLYGRMRGVRTLAASAPRGVAASGPEGAALGELAGALREVAAEVRRLRAALPPPADDGGRDA